MLLLVVHPDFVSGGSGHQASVVPMEGLRGKHGTRLTRIPPATWPRAGEDKNYLDRRLNRTALKRKFVMRLTG